MSYLFPFPSPLAWCSPLGDSRAPPYSFFFSLVFFSKGLFRFVGFLKVGVQDPTLSLRCFLGQETSLHVFSLHSGVKWVMANYCWVLRRAYNPAMDKQPFGAQGGSRNTPSCRISSRLQYFPFQITFLCNSRWNRRRTGSVESCFICGECVTL